MATLHFTGSDVKVFTPISSALANLPNGPGTLIALVRNTAVGATSDDVCGLLDSGGGNWYHSLLLGSGFTASNALTDDDGLVGVNAGVTTSTGSDWFFYAIDWGTGTATESGHSRDLTTGGSWTHANSAANNGGLRAGPGTSGWFRIGYTGDGTIDGLDIGVIAVWAGTRFSTSDYGTWTKTSDLYNHALGHPTFLCECNASTLVDLIAGSTYSSANSSGTALTGADPTGWTFDGTGTVTETPAPNLVMAPYQGAF